MSGNPKISIEIEQNIYAQYKELAHHEGVSLEDWARRVLSEASPKDSGSSAAFEALEESHRKIGSIRRIHPPEKPPEAPKAAPKTLPPGHPCSLYVPGISVGGKAREAKCKAKYGKPCNWPAPVASGCSLFLLRTRYSG